MYFDKYKSSQLNNIFFMEAFTISQETKDLLQQQYNGNLNNIGSYIFNGKKYLLAIHKKCLVIFDIYGNPSNLSNQELGLVFMPCVFVYNKEKYEMVSSSEILLDTPSVFIFSTNRELLEQSIYGCKRVSYDYNCISYNYIIIFNKPSKEVVTNREIINQEGNLISLYKQFCPNIQQEYKLAYSIIDVKNNRTLEYKYWNTLNGRMLFIDNLKIYVITDNEFCSLGFQSYIWSHGDSYISIVDIDNSKKDLLKVKLLSPGKKGFIYFESRFRNSNTPYNFSISKKALIIHRGKDGILVIDRYGNELWNANTDLLYEISCVRDNLIYYISAYKYICIFDLKGEKILETNIIILGNGDIKTSDWSNLAVSSLNNRYGVIDINKKIEIAPCVYDNIVIIKFEDLPDNPNADYDFDLSIEDYKTKTNEYFLASLKNELYTSYILFSGKECLIQPGQFEEIIPIQYCDSMYESHYKKNQYGIEVYSPIIDRKNKYTGWFLLKNESDYYFRFSNTTYKISSLIEFWHPKECALYLIVRTSNGIGLLSPLGWIFEPTHKTIIRFTTDGSDRFYGSSDFFGRWHVFLVDNDIYRVRINYNGIQYYNDVEIIFSSNGEYKYMSWESNICVGIDFSFKRLTDNRKIIINIFCSVLHKYSEKNYTYNDEITSQYFYKNVNYIYCIENGLVKIKTQ